MADTRGRRFLGFLMLALPLAACDRAATITAPSVAAAGGPVAAITGHVLGPDGAPLAGVTVLVSDEANRYTGQSDGAGRFEIDRVPLGTWTMTWSEDGFLPVTQTVAIDGDVNLDESLALDANPPGVPPPLQLARVHGR